MKKLFDRMKTAAGKESNPQNSLVGKTVQIGQYSVKVELLVGEGGFASIYRVRDSSTNQPFALKHSRLQADSDAIKEVQHEAKTMAKLKGHPNILRLHAVAFAGPTGAETDGFMLLDFCPVTLLELMQRSSFALEDVLVYEVFAGICNAIAHMHRQSPPLAHRDVKAENVLKNSEGHWVICDFGSSTSRAQIYESPADIANEEEIIRRTTTPAYRAPEMWDLLGRQRIDTKADIWALGVLLFVLAFGRLPFAGDSKLQVIHGKYEIPGGRPSAMTGLIRAMLKIDPAERPDITAVITMLQALRQAVGAPPPTAVAPAAAPAAAAPAAVAAAPAVAAPPPQLAPQAAVAPGSVPFPPTAPIAVAAAPVGIYPTVPSSHPGRGPYSGPLHASPPSVHNVGAHSHPTSPSLQRHSDGGTAAAAAAAAAASAPAAAAATADAGASGGGASSSHSTPGSRPATPASAEEPLLDTVISSSDGQTLMSLPPPRGGHSRGQSLLGGHHRKNNSLGKVAFDLLGDTDGPPPPAAAAIPPVTLLEVSRPPAASVGAEGASDAAAAATAAPPTESGWADFGAGSRTVAAAPVAQHGGAGALAAHSPAVRPHAMPLPQPPVQMPHLGTAAPVQQLQQPQQPPPQQQQPQQQQPQVQQQQQYGPVRVPLPGHIQQAAQHVLHGGGPVQSASPNHSSAGGTSAGVYAHSNRSSGGGTDATGDVEMLKGHVKNLLASNNALLGRVGLLEELVSVLRVGLQHMAAELSAVKEQQHLQQQQQQQQQPLLGGYAGGGGGAAAVAGGVAAGATAVAPAAFEDDDEPSFTLTPS